jgi:hypothetical protein
VRESARFASGLIFPLGVFVGSLVLAPFVSAQSETDTARVSIRVGKTVQVTVSGVENVNGRAMFVEVKNRTTAAVTQVGPIYTDGEGKADADLSEALTGGGVFLIKARDAATGVDSATMSLAISVLELSLAPPAIKQGQTAQARTVAW